MAVSKPTPKPKNPKQSAKTKRASNEAAAIAKAKANSEKLKLAARERKSPGRGPIPSGVVGSETRKTVPKQKRQAFEAGMTQYNKEVKKLVKSGSTKASDDAVVAKNKSGGKKPFSKGTYGPTGPKVPVKPKGGRGGGGLAGGIFGTKNR